MKPKHELGILEKGDSVRKEWLEVIELNGKLFLTGVVVAILVGNGVGIILVLLMQEKMDGLDDGRSIVFKFLDYLIAHQ